MISRILPKFVANSAAFQDVPESLIDQLVDAGIPGHIRWESVMWQVREVGGLGSVRWQVQASIDGAIWTDLVGGVASPTEGEINPPDLGPGDISDFTLTTQNGPDVLAFRFFRVQALSPLGDPNRYGQIQVTIFAR